MNGLIQCNVKQAPAAIVWLSKLI